MIFFIWRKNNVSSSRLMCNSNIFVLLIISLRYLSWQCDLGEGLCATRGWHCQGFPYHEQATYISASHKLSHSLILNALFSSSKFSSTWNAKAVSLFGTISGISPLSVFCVALESLFSKEFLLFFFKGWRLFACDFLWHFLWGVKCGVLF